VRYFLLLIFILIFNCQQKSDDRINLFEETLGRRKTKALDLLVSDFEDNLKKIYPNLSIEEGYRKYMNDIISESNSNSKKFEFQSDITDSEFHKSGLWDEIYELSNDNDEFEVDSVKTINSKNTGKYMFALFKVKDSDSLLKTYWKYREAGGLIQHEIVVDGILSLKPNFNDYFHKRITVVEFSY